MRFGFASGGIAGPTGILSALRQARMDASMGKDGPRHSTASDERLRQVALRRYSDLSKKPLHVLFFLLPLLLLYEIGSLVYLTDHATGGAEKIRAYKILTDLCASIGISGEFLFYLPGIALIVVLLVWHIVTRESWRPHGRVIGLMWLESLLLLLPLLVLSQLIARIGASDIALAQTSTPLSDLAWQQRLLISVGAGLYEELLFRMVLIGALLVLLTDVLNLEIWLGNVIAVTISALLFVIYHNPIADGQVLWSAVALYLTSGLYLGCLFLWRGFGIVVAVHALYDVMVLLVLPPLVSG